MGTKVSIIVPVYNAEPYLGRCLESLTQQTLDEIEIICVDNCSTDRSRDIIRKWVAEDQRIKFIFNEENIGQGGSMIRGLENATGKYIAECDADDWVETNAYEIMYRAAEAVGADVVRCNVIKHYNGIEERFRNGGPSIYNIAFCPREQDEQTLQCVIGRWCCIPAGIYNRKFIQDNDIWYRADTQFEDNSLSFKIRTTANKYMYIADFLYHYRMDNPGSGTATITTVDGIFEQFQEIQRYAQGMNIDELITTWKYYVYTWAFSKLKDNGSRQAFLARCREDFTGNKYKEELFNNDQDLKIFLSIKDGTPPRA